MGFNIISLFSPSPFSWYLQISQNPAFSKTSKKVFPETE